jgi:hypothetical protein
VPRPAWGSGEIAVRGDQRVASGHALLMPRLVTTVVEAVRIAVKQIVV